MECKIVEKKEFQVIGVNRKINIKNKGAWREIPKFWKEYKETDMESSLKKYAVDDVVYAVTTHTGEPETFWYLISVAYNGIENKDNYEIMTIPGGTYAVFEVPSECEKNIGDFTMRIFEEWLPKSGYKLTGTAEIECETKNGTVIWMPIKK